jgi:alpha-L-arabinofuranosidase
VEEIYNYTDALTVASLLHAILRNTRTVAMANISMVTNTLGSIFTDHGRMVRQTIWYPQKLLRDAHTGRVVETVVDAPVFKAKHERFFCGVVDVAKARDEKLPTLQHFDDVAALDVVASVDKPRGKLTLSIIQKLEDRPLTVRLDLHGLTPAGETMTVHRLTGGDNLLAENTLDHPDRVGLATEKTALTTTCTFPPASLTVLEISLR